MSADNSSLLRAALAERTDTCASDWFLTYKARYGMSVVFSAIRDQFGAGEVVTQLYTCCTAVDPITDAKLTPVYADVRRDTLTADLATVSLGPDTRAVVLQHSFGIIDAQADQELCAKAHAVGALVIEDDAHCVGRMAKGSDGPLADVVVFSFGVEKMLPSSYFGGAIWVNPSLQKDVRAKIVDALDRLPALDAKLAEASKNYKSRLRTLNHVPGTVSARLRRKWLASGAFEPAITEIERKGGLPHQPMAPDDGICAQALSSFAQLDVLEEQHARCARIYTDAFSKALADEPDLSLWFPKALLASCADQPLLRFPLFLTATGAAELAERKIREMGAYAVRWYEKALYPGVLDGAAYNFDGQLESWPSTNELSGKVVCLPCDVAPEQAEEVARVAIAIARASRGITPDGTPVKDLVKSEKDVASCLAPVILGGDILGYTYARSFHELYGMKTTILSGINVRMTSSSRFVDYRILDGMNDEKRTIEHLCAFGIECALAGKRGLAIGSADWHARVLSKNKELLSTWFVVPYIDFDLLDDITQKERFYQICEELDIPYPKTWALDFSDASLELDAGKYPYPLIAKPSNSAAYDMLEFAGKKKIYEIETPEELVEAFEAVKKGGYRHKLILQDFIPGEDDAIRSLTTFSDATGDMRVVSGGTVVLQDHSPEKIGNPVTILSEKVDKIISDAQKFLKATGYRGYANFDIKYDSRDGSYKFFEVNTRAGRNTYYVTLGGVNMAQPIVKDWVLEDKIEYTEAYNDFVYTLVPPVVIEKSVKDQRLRKRVLKIYKEGKALSPLDYAPDTLAHKGWWNLYYRHQVSKFKKYLWNVSE